MLGRSSWVKSLRLSGNWPALEDFKVQLIAYLTLVKSTKSNVQNLTGTQSKQNTPGLKDLPVISDSQRTLLFSEPSSMGLVLWFLWGGGVALSSSKWERYEQLYTQNEQRRVSPCRKAPKSNSFFEHIIGLNRVQQLAQLNRHLISSNCVLGPLFS
jgi:hypothetical protein